MTREHKLALIVGFSLVLVLGVLLSDHFSKARNMDPAIAAAQAGQAGQFGAANPLVAVTPPVTLPPTNPVQQQHIVVAPPRLRGDEPSPSPSVLQRSTVDIVTAVPRSELENRSIPGTPSPNAALAGIDETPIENLPNSALPVSRQPLRRHEVKEGDSIYRIASSAYGDGNLWTKIRDYPGNKGKIGENGSMREGVTLLLPPSDVLLGKAVLASERVGGSSSISETPGLPRSDPQSELKPESKTPVKTATYTVKAGDTLASIARRKLGSAGKVQDLIDLNRSTLSDPDDLKIGMVLKIPSR